MAVQIRGRQILNGTLLPAKLDLTQTYNFSSGTLQCGSPSADADVANKAFVEAHVAGLAWKDACAVATTANITISEALNVGDAIDGYTLQAGDRVLVKNQSTASQNGIYVAGASPARAADMDAGSEFSSAAVFVQRGSVGADIAYVCTNDGTVNVGTDAINFTQFTGAAQIVAGAGLVKSGNTLSANVDDSSLEIESDTIQVKALGVTNAMLAGSIANAKLANSTISGVALGANLNSLSLASNSGLTMSSYNGSAAVSDLKLNITQLSAGTAQMIDEIALDRAGTTVRESLQDIFGLAAGTASATSLAASSGVLSVKIDDTSIARDGSGNLTVKANGIGSGEIATNAVGSSEIAANAVTASELADNAVTVAKLGYAGYFERIAVGDGSTSSVDLARAIDTDLAPSFVVAVNGVCLEYKATPDSIDNYKIDNTGSGSVGKITFGASLTNGDVITIRYIA